MHPPMRCAATLLTSVLLLLPIIPLHAQPDAGWKGQAVSAMMAYRVSVLGDTTSKFDPCSMARRLDAEASDMPHRIAEGVRGMLLTQCVPPAERRMRAVVLVDSLAWSGEGDAKAYITVVRGEWVHREDYTLVPHGTGSPMMGVREVRVWGASQAYSPRPPSRSTATAP